MKRFVPSVLIGLVLGGGLWTPAQPVEIQRWERLPLRIPLVVGEERVVFIDRNVRVGLPQSLGGQLRVQSAGGAIYLRANEPIPLTRLQLQDVESGALILIDIAAEPAQSGRPLLEPIRIVEGTVMQSRSGARDGPEDLEGERAADAAAKASTRATPVPVLLTRYAAQNLYAPLRTVEPVSGLGRVNLRRDLPLQTLLPTLPVHAQALAAWRLEDQWVTAVRLRNTSQRWLGLDPRALQGDFISATFQHADLGPAGQFTDTTVVYLVTRGRGLEGAVLPTVAPVNAAVNLPPADVARQTEGVGDEK